MDYKGTVTMTAAEYLEMVDRIRHLETDKYLLNVEMEKVKKALETAEKKLAEEDNF